MKIKTLWMVIAKHNTNIEVGMILSAKKPTPSEARNALGFDKGGTWWIFKAKMKPPVVIETKKETAQRLKTEHNDSFDSFNCFA
jgi:hypothetical protein